MTRRFTRFLRRNTIALLALFIALGGTTYAATALPKNSVGPKQLRKNAVTNTKIAKNAVTGAKVKDNALTGADILESSLGQVPSAKDADHAVTADKVGGLALQKFSFRAPAGTVGTNVLTLDGLALNAVCGAGM